MGTFSALRGNVYGAGGFLILVHILGICGIGMYLRELWTIQHRPSIPLITYVPQAHNLTGRVALLVPARDEAHTIARCLDGALAQTYPQLEILVLDDHSTDGTAAILAGYMPDSRLRVLQGEALPNGWTGKCYACQQLAAAATGEWLLFIDADTAPQPGLVASLVAYAEQQQCDLLSIWPFLELGSFWEKAILPAFYALIALVYPLPRVNAPDARPSAVLANGQCLLIRRSAYEAIGGHGAVRSEVLEDVQLAQQMRKRGYRVHLAHGSALLRVRMYRNGPEVLAGLTKNAAAGYRSGGGRSFFAANQLLLAINLPFWFLGLAWLARRRGKHATGTLLMAYGTGLFALAWRAWGERLHRLHGLPRHEAWRYPLGVTSYLLIALRAMWQVARGKGVVWKGRRYEG
jgi:chlorobactene glucosyltransferase